MKENTIYSLTEEIKLESGQASDLAAIFRKYRHIEKHIQSYHRDAPTKCRNYRADSIAHLQGKGRDGKETGRLK